MAKPYEKVLERIAQRVLDNTATADEVRFLQQYYDAFDDIPEDIQQMDDNAKARLNQEIREMIRQRVKKPAFGRVRYAAAAVILVALCIGFYFFAHEDSRAEMTLQEIRPGGNRATLTLADGKAIELSSDQEGIITGNTITYTDGTVLADSVLQQISRPEDLRLTTPRGGQYKVTLPDGSLVWLNAASTLRYPAQFDENRRIVELTGEAFFEIKKKDRSVPFIVKTANQEVEVLGTQFNVSASPDEATTKTTLVEGRVRVSLAQNELNAIEGASDASLSSPGQQSILAESGLFIKQVDIDSYTGWRNGWFILHHLSMRDIMLQIERWYDVEVDYHSLPNGVYYGEIKRDESLLNVLKMIETISKVKFEVNGRRIMVQK